MMRLLQGLRSIDLGAASPSDAVVGVDGVEFAGVAGVLLLRKERLRRWS